VLLFSQNFSFYSCTRLRPLIQNLLCLFISSFFLKFSVLVFKPDWFELLFNDVVRWVIVEIWGTAFKPVLGFELDRLLTPCGLISRIESIEWFSSDCLFWLIKRWNIWGTCHSLVVSKSSARYIKRISNMSEDKARLVRQTRLDNSFLLFSILCLPLFDFINASVVFF
jgi:hypothetical protein